MIQIAQDVGIPLAEIAAALASLPDSRTPTRRDWAALSRGWRAEIDRRILELEALRDGLDGCIGCGCLSLAKCRLRNRDDRLAGRGPGAHLAALE